MAFASNPSIRYQVKQNEPLIIAREFNKLNLFLSENAFVTIELQNHFDKYHLPRVTSDEIVNRWRTEPLKFYQNQINSVVWCATSGCGVSYPHFNNPDQLVACFYTFHVYYQTRRLLTLPAAEGLHTKKKCT